MGVLGVVVAVVLRQVVDRSFLALPMFPIADGDSLAVHGENVSAILLVEGCASLGNALPADVVAGVGELGEATHVVGLAAGGDGTAKGVVVHAGPIVLRVEGAIVLGKAGALSTWKVGAMVARDVDAVYGLGLAEIVSGAAKFGTLFGQALAVDEGAAGNVDAGGEVFGAHLEVDAGVLDEETPIVGLALVCKSELRAGTLHGDFQLCG